MESSKPSPLTTTTNTLISFFALYLTTLFSLDTWTSARNSPFRAPSAANNLHRSTTTAPATGSYQAGMHGRGNAGPGSGGGGGGRGSRDVGRVDSRPPIRMGGTAACGACMI